MAIMSVRTGSDGRIGANHCRLRHIGWEKCGYGLAYRPKETAGRVTFLDELLVLFRCPPRSALALLEGNFALEVLCG